ncbi:MAG: hypothetical protein ABI611_14725 [Solirubrobacteraceae bacterium]
MTHLLHVLGFVAMEPPIRFDAQSLREQNDRLFEAIKPLDPTRVVYGQYDGYRSEPGVANDSTTGTFAALEVEVDNERWAGVRFQLRTGKALAESRHTVTFGFKAPPLQKFELAADVSPAGSSGSGKSRRRCSSSPRDRCRTRAGHGGPTRSTN